MNRTAELRRRALKAWRTRRRNAAKSKDTDQTVSRAEMLSRRAKKAWRTRRLAAA